MNKIVLLLICSRVTDPIIITGVTIDGRGCEILFLIYVTLETDVLYINTNINFIIFNYNTSINNNFTYLFPFHALNAYILLPSFCSS